MKKQLQQGANHSSSFYSAMNRFGTVRPFRLNRRGVCMFVWGSEADELQVLVKCIYYVCL